MFQPESLVSLREKDAPALRVSYSEIKEQYETVLDERAAANKKLERMQQKNHDLQVALDAADEKAASVSRPGLSLELEQAKSKTAELHAALKDEVAKSKAAQSELEATRSELKASRDCVRDLDSQISTVVAKNDILKVFRDRIVHALDEFDGVGDDSDPQTTGPRLPDPSSLNPNPPVHPPDSTLTVNQPAKADPAEEGPDSPLVAEFETSNPDHDVEPKAEVPEEPEPSPPPTQAPAPTPKGAYLAQPRISVPNHAIASRTSSWGPTPRQWMTIKQQEDFKDQLAELEASQDDNKPPVDSTIPVDPFLAAAQRQKRDASAADLASDPNKEPVRQENWVTHLEGLACQSPPGGPERKKPRLNLSGRASQEPASFAEVQPSVVEDPSIHDASTAKPPEWREERRDVSSDGN